MFSFSSQSPGATNCGLWSILNWFCLRWRIWIRFLLLLVRNPVLPELFFENAVFCAVCDASKMALSETDCFDYLGSFVFHFHFLTFFLFLWRVTLEFSWWLCWNHRSVLVIEPFYSITFPMSPWAWEVFLTSSACSTSFFSVLKFPL